MTLPTGITEHKYYVGDAVVTKRSNSTTDTFYLHKDQQGSTTAITNAAGTIVQQLMYDPWGKQFLVNNSILTYSSPAQSKGYTGHEMVNDLEVIHMGGRTYNPTLGRFMQADPFIQQPGNLQSYNRYAYVQNNPMSYTDPSGYFLKKLMQVTGVTAAMKFLAKNPFLNAIAQVVVAYYGGPIGSALFNFAQSYSVTGSLGGAMRAGAFAYAGASVGALGDLGGVAGFAASGMAGGLLSVLQGGKFGHGFVSAGLSASLGGLGGRVSNPLGQVLVSAVIGGTISKVTGGKFINGAGSAAFAAALRADWGGSSYKRQGVAATPRSDEEKIKFEKDFVKLKSMAAKAGTFKSSDDAASWLHNNIQSALEIDVEVGAYIYGSDKSGFYIGELHTDYMRNSVNMIMVGQAHSSWHSHGTNSFYWRPSAGINNDSGHDVDDRLNYGYTSTSWNGGTLWRFEASRFQGEHSWGNTCKYLNNMSGGRGC